MMMIDWNSLADSRCVRFGMEYKKKSQAPRCPLSSQHQTFWKMAAFSVMQYIIRVGNC